MAKYICTIKPELIEEYRKHWSSPSADGWRVEVEADDAEQAAHQAVSLERGSSWPIGRRDERPQSAQIRPFDWTWLTCEVVE